VVTCIQFGGKSGAGGVFFCDGVVVALLLVKILNPFLIYLYVKYNTLLPVLRILILVKK